MIMRKSIPWILPSNDQKTIKIPANKKISVLPIHSNVLHTLCIVSCSNNNGGPNHAIVTPIKIILKKNIL
jgi:hypothetical protein